MQEKFLPIGTICQIKGNDKKIMITGYQKSVFNNYLKIYDYIGVIYPEGMLAPNRIATFDAKDISEIIYHGLENEEYHKFKKLVNGLEPQIAEEKQKFKKVNETFSTSTDTFSKLVFDENGVVMFAEQANNNLPEFEFDANGYVIREKRKEVVNPFLIQKDHEFDKNGYVLKEEKTIGSILKEEDYEFDANGVVVKDKKNKQSRTVLKNGFEFDENGYVLKEEKTIDSLLKEEDYEFDENGTVIAVN